MIPKIEGLKTSEIRCLIQSCKTYIQTDLALPLEQSYRTDKTFRKLKLRHKNKLSNDVLLNTAFEKAIGYSKLRQRSLLITPLTHQDYYSNYYIFPTNGFKVLYNPSVKSSTDLDEELFKPLIELTHQDTSEEIISDIFKQFYLSESLQDGILSDCEILIYNIPFCYLVHKRIGDFFEIIDTLRTAYV